MIPEKKKALLNNFYIHFMRPNQITGECYRNFLQEELGMHPMQADFKEVHRAQRKLLKVMKLR